jgi:hypothetical protein
LAILLLSTVQTPRVPSTDRRTLLATAGSLALGSLAGCSFGSSAPPAGSLAFENRHDAPHAVSLRVVDVGTRAGVGKSVEGDPDVPAEQRDLTASVTLDPSETETYESVFTEPVLYVVEWTVDGWAEGDVWTVVYTPTPRGSSKGRTLRLEVSETGELAWTVRATDDLGEFDD